MRGRRGKKGKGGKKKAKTTFANQQVTGATFALFPRETCFARAAAAVSTAWRIAVQLCASSPVTTAPEKRKTREKVQICTRPLEVCRDFSHLVLSRCVFASGEEEGGGRKKGTNNGEAHVTTIGGRHCVIEFYSEFLCF